MIDELTYHYPDFDIDSILINCHYPISPNKFVLMYGIKVKQTDDIRGEKAQELATAMASYITIGFEQDVAIWKNKTRIENPLLCEEDGPVYQLRRWYEQFLRRRRRHQPGHDQPFRVRDGHHQAGRGLAARGRREHGAPGGRARCFELTPTDDPRGAPE